MPQGEWIEGFSWDLRAPPTSHCCSWIHIGVHGTGLMISRHKKLRNNQKRGGWECFFPSWVGQTFKQGNILDQLSDGTSLFRSGFNPWTSSGRVEMSRSALGDPSYNRKGLWALPTPVPEQSHPENLRAILHLQGSVCVHLHKIKQRGSEPGMKVRENSK